VAGYRCPTAGCGSAGFAAWAIGVIVMDTSRSAAQVVNPRHVNEDVITHVVVDERLAGGDVGVPVEHHGLVPVADHDLGAVLRARLGEGRPVDGLVPVAVMAEIEARGLYTAP